MSPIGGVGINLAIQDAVAAANLLWEPLRGRTLAIDHLKAVQRRRELPVRLMQAVQVAVQNRIISTTLGLQAQPSLPWQGKLLNAVPFLRRIPARIMGLGFRPEHVRTPDVRASRPTPPAP
jgi:2-polyprenyl-6-methoxyphenol hydroxylase-like FAD-dependent oxidoreductase